MELPQLVVCEWREDHCLSRLSLRWIHDHADIDDPHPVATAVAMLRATVTDIDTASARRRDPQSVTVVPAHDAVMRWNGQAQTTLDDDVDVELPDDVHMA